MGMFMEPGMYFEKSSMKQNRLPFYGYHFKLIPMAVALDLK